MALEVMVRSREPIALDAAFRVEPSELLALVGHSGAGKTTLLRTIAGLWRPAQGRVAVNGAAWLDTGAGVNLPPHRRRVGLVFQTYALFPHMSALGNVMAAMDSPDAREAARLLDLLNLHGLAARLPAQLSGGQQQRVAVARALARKPDALLLDEPFSAVDRATRERLHAQIVALRGHLRMPVVLVTHDVAEAQHLADRMIVLDRGRVLHQGTTAAMMADPAALRALGIGARATVLPATLEAHLQGGLGVLRTAGGPLVLSLGAAGQGEPVGARLGVRVPAGEVIVSRPRPEGLSTANILAGTITRIEPEATPPATLGTGPAPGSSPFGGHPQPDPIAPDSPGVTLHIAIGADRILALVPRHAVDALSLRPGAAVHAILGGISVTRAPLARD